MATRLKAGGPEKAGVEKTGVAQARLSFPSEGAPKDSRAALLGDDIQRSNGSRGN